MQREDDGKQRLVIFDFDGTLADSWNWMANELVAAAEASNFKKVTRDELEGYRSLNTREVFKRLEVPWWRVPRLASHLRRRAEASVNDIRLFDGVPALIRSLHGAGLRLAVISSNSEPVVRGVLGEPLHRLIDCFDCSASVFGKAAKLKRAMRKLGIEVSHATAVGDETRDVEAAEKAGIGVLAAEWGYADPELLRRVAPDRTVSSIDELARRLLTR